MSHDPETSSQALAKAARDAFQPSPEELSRGRAGLSAKLTNEPSGVWPRGSARLLLPGLLVVVGLGAGAWLLREPVAPVAEPPEGATSRAGQPVAATRGAERGADAQPGAPHPPEAASAVLEAEAAPPPPPVDPAPPAQVEVSPPRRSPRASPEGTGVPAEASAAVEAVPVPPEQGGESAPGPVAAQPESILAREAARLMRARAAIREGRPAEALSLTTTPPDGDPLNPERRAVRALAYCGLGQVDAARRVAGRLVDGTGPSGVALRASCVGETQGP